MFGDGGVGAGGDELGSDGGVYACSGGSDDEPGGGVSPAEPVGGFGGADEELGAVFGVFEDDKLLALGFEESSDDASDFEDFFSDEGLEGGGGDGLGDSELVADGEVFGEGLGGGEAGEGEEGAGHGYGEDCLEGIGGIPHDRSVSWGREGNGGQAGIRTREGM